MERNFMKLLKNRTFQIIAGAIIYLLLLNPSSSRFQEFMHEPPVKYHEFVHERTFNGLIFSIYQKQSFNNSGHLVMTEKYLGICSNFFRIESEPNSTALNS
jgi:hypothetical protein